MNQFLTARKVYARRIEDRFFGCKLGREAGDMMMKEWKGLNRDQKGFSLVELLCAVAILSIVILGVGASMVVSARSYSRGSTELDLQQQAQITATLLSNLIIDADTIVEPSTEAGGTRLEVTKMETVGNITAGVTYVVAFDEASQKEIGGMKEPWSR